VTGELPEVGQRRWLIDEEVSQTAMSLPQIAGRTGRHYVAAGAIAATELRLHMINRQCRRRELRTAVDAPPLVPLEHSLSFHDGRVS
jgi:hypothetical protein